MKEMNKNVMEKRLKVRKREKKTKIYKEKIQK